MDLADLWAQHKKFILAVAGALLLLLIGRGVLHGKFPAEEVHADATKIESALGRTEEIPDSVVRAMEGEVNELRARYAELAKSMRFGVGDEFKLPPNESNPRSFFFKRVKEMQRALVDAAEHQDIRVPEALGLKDRTPTDPEEIRRTLVALEVIQTVIVESIGAGVRRVESIRIEDEQRGRVKATGFLKELHVDFEIVGGERALRTMVAGLIDGAAAGRSPYLAVDKARLHPVKGEEGMLALRLSLMALDLEKSEDEETP
jgi:hypothetical protein